MISNLSVCQLKERTDWCLERSSQKSDETRINDIFSLIDASHMGINLWKIITFKTNCLHFICLQQYQALFLVWWIVDDCEIGLGPFMSKLSRFNYIYVTPTKSEWKWKKLRGKRNIITSTPSIIPIQVLCSKAIAFHQSNPNDFLYF